MHEANTFEDDNIFLHSFLKKRKTGEGFFVQNPNDKAKGDQSCLLSFNLHVLRRVCACERAHIRALRASCTRVWVGGNKLRALRRGLTYIKAVRDGLNTFLY